MASNFGPRNTHRSAPSRAEVSPRITDPRPTPSFDQMVAASSRLVVVRAFTSALPLVRLRHLNLERVCLEELPWGDGLVERLGDGTLDLVLYNELRGRALSESYESVHCLGIVGYSMGGRNFCMLTNVDSRWATSTLADLREGICDATLVVGRSTDRFQNALDVLGLTEADLDRRRIAVLDIPDAPCSLLESMPDALMVCGQNRRFEVRQHRRLKEVDGFGDVPEDVKALVRRRSANALFVSSRLMDASGVTEKELLLDFARGVSDAWASHYEILLDLVAREAEFDSLDMVERREAAQQIIFDTYRFGAPE